MNSQRRAVWILGGACALGIGVAAAVLGLREIGESRSDARIAESRALAAQAIANADSSPDLALLLAVEAFELSHEDPAADSYEARNALVTTFQRVLHIRAILRGHKGPVTAVAFSPRRTLVASGGRDGTVRLWNRRTRAEIAQLNGHKGLVTSVAFSPDGTLLASTGRDSVIRLWNVDRGTRAGELRGHRGGVREVVFSPDGRTLASRGDELGWGFSNRPDGTVRLWDVARRSQLGATLRVSASGMRFNADGSRLTVVDYVGLITEHAAQRPRPYSEPGYDTGYTEYYQSEFTTSGSLLALSGEDGFEVWRVRGTMSRPVQILGSFGSRIVSAGRGRIGVGGSDGSLTYWDTAYASRTLEPGSSMSFANGGIASLSFSHNGGDVAVGGEDGTVRLATLGDPVLRLLSYDSQGTRPVEPIRSPDGRWIARLGQTDYNSFRTPVTIRDAATREETGQRLETLDSAVAFHPDGRRVALVGRNRRIAFWDVERGIRAGEPLPSGFPPLGATHIALSSDGNVIAAWGVGDVTDEFDAGFVLWDTARWAPIGEPVPVGIYSYGDEERLSFDNRDETFVYQSDFVRIALDPLLVSSDLERWRQRVCSLVARNLTEQEWRLYVPGRSYRETCPGLD